MHLETGSSQIQSVLLGLLLAVFSANAAERLCGLERLEHMERLPEFLERTRVFQISSHDRRGKNMGDGYYATHPCLYTDANGEKVLFDEKTPGCLYRFWMTFSSDNVLTNQLRFYFDGETTARLEISVGAFFSGTNAPFLTPLVGNGTVSCKGYYSYFPFEYEEGLKITISDVPTGTGTQASPFYYNITFHRFDSAEGVKTWDGTEDPSGVVSMLSEVGADPKSTNENLRITGSLNLLPATSTNFVLLTGAGAIQSIRMNPTPSSLSVLRNCRLQMNWDGGTAEVDAPLGDFFGSGTNEMEVASLMLGMSTNGDYYCYFPMPYWQSAQFSLTNASTEQVVVPFEVQYTTNAYNAAENGYFYAEHQLQNIENDGEDVCFLQTQGKGHFVGLSVYILGLDYTGNNLDHLEGDERIYLDESSSPAIYGTGTEDYFNCAWYFNGAPKCLPYHGCALQEFNPQPPNATQAYRLHLADPLPFQTHFRFGMEHGRANNTRGIYSSVAYFYKRSESGWEQTATLNPATASSSVYQASNAVEKIRTWCFEGEDDQTSMTATGSSFTAFSEFEVPITTNAGVVLRRLTDRTVGRQKASVFVDGTRVGCWYDADCNLVTQRLYNTETYLVVSQRWNEAEFQIPLELTAGKTNLHIRIERDSDGASEWNEYRYDIFCVKPLEHPDDADDDGLPDSWETIYFNHVGLAVPDADADLDGMSTHDEYVAGTSPVDSNSLFRIVFENNNFQFMTYSGRTYRIWSNTNLLTGSWQSISNFPGTDSSFQIQPSQQQEFIRIDVQKDE